MDCTKFHELISIYLDEEASSVQRQALEKHMESCSVCKSYLASQIKLKEMIKSSYQTSIDADFSASIMSKISAPAEIRKPSRMKKLSVFVAAAAAVCILAIAALMSLNVDNNKIAGNEKLEEYVIEHVGSGAVIPGVNGQVEAVNIEK